jgi:hypothetical protein
MKQKIKIIFKNLKLILISKFFKTFLKMSFVGFLNKLKQLGIKGANFIAKKLKDPEIQGLISGTVKAFTGYDPTPFVKTGSTFLNKTMSYVNKKYNKDNNDNDDDSDDDNKNNNDDVDVSGTLASHLSSEPDRIRRTEYIPKSKRDFDYSKLSNSMPVIPTSKNKVLGKSKSGLYNPLIEIDESKTGTDNGIDLNLFTSSKKNKNITYGDYDDY